MLRVTLREPDWFGLLDPAVMGPPIVWLASIKPRACMTGGSSRPRASRHPDRALCLPQPAGERSTSGSSSVRRSSKKAIVPSTAGSVSEIAR